MEPGHSYEIAIELPEDHTRGTYWYHPHHHGSADIQMSSGMVGAVIIGGDFADVPEIAAARERLLVLTQVVYDASGMIEDFETLFPEGATRFLAINGQRRPMIEMRPGEVQRWRILNAAYQDDMLLDLEKHGLHAVAYDGIQLGGRAGDEAASDRAGPARRSLGAGGRCRHLCVERCTLRSGTPLAGRPIGEGRGVRRADGDEAARSIAAAALANHQGNRNHQPSHGDLSATAPEADAAGHWQEFGFTWTARSSIPRASTSGSARRGRGVDDRNTHEHDDHVFHVHTNPFQVVSAQRQALAVPEWRDTVVIAAGQRRQRRFRSRFLDFTGVFMRSLPHDEPRGDGHDADGRGLQGLTPRPRTYRVIPGDRPYESKHDRRGQASGLGRRDHPMARRLCLARRRHLAVLGAAMGDRHADRSRPVPLAVIAGVVGRARDRRDLSDRRALSVRRAGGMDRRAAVSPMLRLAPRFVQDLERRHGRRQHLHVAAGGPDDLADRRAGGDLHAVAAGCGTARTSRRSTS